MSRDGETREATIRPAGIVVERTTLLTAAGVTPLACDLLTRP